MKLHALATALPYLHARLTSIQLKMPGSPGMPVPLSMTALAQALDGLGAAVREEIEGVAGDWETTGPALPAQTWDDPIGGVVSEEDAPNALWG